MVPSSWLSIDVALAHYRAIESLKLDPEALRENGRNLAEKLHNSFLGTLIRGLRVGGVVSPLTIAPRLDLVWSRSVRGGGLRVVRTAPKDIMIEVHRFPVMELQYCQIAFEGVIEASMSMLAKRVFVRGTEFDADRSVYEVSWA